MKSNPFLEQQFASTCRRLRVEREEATAIVRELLLATPVDAYPTLAPQMATHGALEIISELFSREQNRNPQKAHGLAELAVAIANNLAEDYPAVIRDQSRAYAYKDLGKSFRTLGRIKDSIEALEHAERQIASSPAGDYDLAVVRFNLAVSLQEVDRYEDSSRLLAECRAVFKDYGDSANALNCRLYEATLLIRTRRYREARALLYRLLDRYEAILPETSAAIQKALGFANIELAYYNEAEIHLKSAWNIYRDLDLRIDVLRTEIGAGRLLVRRGELQDAMVHLRTLKADLLSENLVEEAGLCDLEIVDALLRDNKPEEAEAVARQVVQDFTDAGLNKRAIEAVGYLSEAVAAKEANTAMITEIGDYILSLRSNPERELRLTGPTA